MLNWVVGCTRGGRESCLRTAETGGSCAKCSQHWQGRHEAQQRNARH